jgi:hypothetical protein
MTTQTKHKRVSSKGKPFLAGSKKEVVTQPTKDATLLVIANMPYFRKLLKPLMNVAREAMIRIGNDGIYATEMDPANVSLIEIAIHNHNGISIRQQKLQGFYINLKTLNDTIKDIKKDVVVTIKTDGNNLKFITPTMNTSIPIMDSTDIKQHSYDKVLENLKPTHKIQMPGDKFLEALKAVQKTSESTIIKSGDSGVELQSSGDTLPPTTSVKLDPTKMERTQAKYSVEYLMYLAPALTDKAIIELQWKTDYPLIANITTQNYEIKYLLAPRIENN